MVYRDGKLFGLSQCPPKTILLQENGLRGAHTPPRRGWFLKFSTLFVSRSRVIIYSLACWLAGWLPVLLLITSSGFMFESWLNRCSLHPRQAPRTKKGGNEIQTTKQMRPSPPESCASRHTPAVANVERGAPRCFGHPPGYTLPVLQVQDPPGVGGCNETAGARDR